MCNRIDSRPSYSPTAVVPAVLRQFRPCLSIVAAVPTVFGPCSVIVAPVVRQLSEPRVARLSQAVSRRQPFDHLLDTVGARLEVAVDFLQRAWWLEHVKVTVE